MSLNRWSCLWLLLLTSKLYATHTCSTCYIDYENGSDTWDGTSKIHTSGTVGPWKHAPGMLSVDNNNATRNDGCIGNCATQVPVAGDRYILKGGVIWPYTVLPWNWKWAGTSTTSGTYGCAGSGCIYIGYDATWNKGIVNSVTLTRDLGGCNPTLPPTVSFSGGGGANAAATVTVVPAAAALVEPNVAGFITHVSVTNQGSGYTSNPTVTISGGGCTLVKAVADIYRPVIDAGLQSGIAWNVGNGPNFNANIIGPGLSLNAGSGYLIVDHLEIRNILQLGRSTNGVACPSAPAGSVSGFIEEKVGAATGHNSITNNYLHYRQSTCNGSTDQQDGDVGILFLQTDEVAYNVLENGESLQLSNGRTACAGLGGNNYPCIFSEMSLYGVGGYTHDNISYATRWMAHLGSGPGEMTVPAIFAHNEFWLVLYDYGSAHQNELYFLFADGTLYEYNNIFHNAVNGASNQQQMGNGTIQYFFNNVSWGLGGGTPNYGIDPGFAEGPSGGQFYFFNNTMQAPSTNSPCINSGSGSQNTALKVVMQNNHCMTSNGPFWVNGASGSTWTNQAGSTSSAAIQSANQVDPYSQTVYAVGNLLGPNSMSSSTVTFAGTSGAANLSNLCSGPLTPLCSDINGNPRPKTGMWQAGAYQFSSSSGGPPPPTLSAVAH